MKRQAFLLAMVAALAILAGCGGGSDDGGTGGGETAGDTTAAAEQGEAMTKAEFIKEGDEVCKKGGEEVGAEATAYAKQNGINLNAKLADADLGEIVENVVLPGVQRQVDGLRSLAPPEGDEEAIATMIDGLQKGVDEGQGDPVTFSTGKTLAAADKELQQYGFKVCGEGAG